MRTLLLYPSFPYSFWHFGKVLALQGKKTMMPPLSLLTVAAILDRKPSVVRSILPRRMFWPFYILDTLRRPSLPAS